jgi:hypothetical protein
MTVKPEGILIYSVGMNLKDDEGRPFGEGDFDDVRIVLPVTP